MYLVNICKLMTSSETGSVSGDAVAEHHMEEEEEGGGVNSVPFCTV